MQQLPENKPKVIALFSKRKSILMAVAAILVLGLMIPIYSRISINSKKLDDATLENYLAYQSNLTQEDLIIGLEIEDIDKVEKNVDLLTLPAD